MLEKGIVTSLRTLWQSGLPQASLASRYIMFAFYELRKTTSMHAEATQKGCISTGQ